MVLASLMQTKHLLIFVLEMLHFVSQRSFRISSSITGSEIALQAIQMILELYMVVSQIIIFIDITMIFTFTITMSMLAFLTTEALIGHLSLTVRRTILSTKEA